MKTIQVSEEFVEAAGAMKFFSLSLCKELAAAGLKSESGFKYYRPSPRDLECSYYKTHPHYFLAPSEYRLVDFYTFDPICDAYSILDLIGPTEVAREKARIWFGEKLHCYDCLEPVFAPMIVGFIQIGTGQCSCSRQFENNIPAWEMHRHAIIDLKKEDEVEEYVKRNRAK